MLCLTDEHAEVARTCLKNSEIIDNFQYNPDILDNAISADCTITFFDNTQ
jgi:hypothetical protein